MTQIVGIGSQKSRLIRHKQLHRALTEKQSSGHLTSEISFKKLALILTKRKCYLKMGKVNRDITDEMIKKLIRLSEYCPYLTVVKPIVRQSLSYAVNMERLKRNYSICFSMKQVKVINDVYRVSFEIQKNMEQGIYKSKDKDNADIKQLIKSMIDPFIEKYGSDADF